MFIIKNAYKSIVRTKGRNILVGIIILTIMAASCVALSIRSAAEIAKATGLQGVNVTAQITVDQEKMRSQMQANAGSSGAARTAGMGQMPQMTREQFDSYSDFDEVADYYYTQQISLNKSSDAFAPYSDSSTSTDTNTSTDSGRPGGQGGERRMMVMGMTADFSLTGYSSESAMTAFYKDKTSTILDGTLFEFSDAKVDGNIEAIINKTLATQNNVKVGDTFTLANSGKADETYNFKVVGIYENSADDSSAMSGIQTSAAMKAENAIYVNSKALQEIIDTSKVAPADVQDPRGNASTSALSDRINATYVFGNVDGYNKFVEDVAAKGLDSNFKVYSADVDNFDKSIVPLDNLSKFATTLLLIILLIGAVVLVVLTLFNIRERKYEVGVYTGIGIRKPKVAAQFAVEILMVTLIAVGVGAGIGGVVSKPVSNAMLANQVQALEQEKTDQLSAMGGHMMPNGRAMGVGGMNRGPGSESFDQVDYVSSVDVTLNPVVVAQLVGIGLLLALLSALISVSFVMRYEPLQILADRS